jgi:hypothetical protein
MSVKKKIKCLVCRILVKLGLKKACSAGPLPTITAEIAKKADKKPAKKTRKTKTK